MHQLTIARGWKLDNALVGELISLAVTGDAWMKRNMVQATDYSVMTET